MSRSPLTLLKENSSSRPASTSTSPLTTEISRLSSTPLTTMEPLTELTSATFVAEST